MIVTIQFRRGESTDWVTKNPILHNGEPGFEANTRKFKVGDGVTPWNDLAYTTGATGPTGP